MPDNSLQLGARRTDGLLQGPFSSPVLLLSSCCPSPALPPGRAGLNDGRGTTEVPKMQNGHETALELVSGADFWCKLMCGAGPGDLGGPGVDLRPKTPEKLKFLNPFENLKDQLGQAFFPTRSPRGVLLRGSESIFGVEVGAGFGLAFKTPFKPLFKALKGL